MPSGKSTYTKQIATNICQEIANGRNLELLGKDKAFPSKQTIYNWFKSIDGFFDEYTRAREGRADWRTADMDKTVEDLKKGKIDYQTARIAIDNHKWQAGKENPKVYGDKLVTENYNKHEHKDVEEFSDAELNKIAASEPEKGE